MSEPISEPMLRIEGLNSFYGKAHILNDLGFSVTRGEVVALLGRNGAGKTTTMKSIMQLVRSRKGHIHFHGTEITGMAPHKVARMGLGYVPEERRIFTDLTILENLEVGRQGHRVDTPFWTEADMFELFPNLWEQRNAQGKAMSGGEQQMLTIARTLMGNPSLLLLDEPSEGIAPIIVEQMAQTILKFKEQGLTVIISEQNLHFAKIVADRTVIIEGGEKKFDGSFDELENHTEIRDAYLSVQADEIETNDELRFRETAFCRKRNPARGEPVSDPAEKAPKTPDPRTHGYVLDEQIGYLLRKAYQRNAVLFGEKVQSGLTPTQFAVMARLTELGSVSQNHLGRTVGLDVATTKGVVDRLHARGLIETGRDPNDRRRQMISLSDAGWQLFEECALLGLDVSQETLSPLTQAERWSLLKILKKLQ